MKVRFRLSCSCCWQPDASQVCSPGLLNVAHTVTNLSSHPIWACRMTDYRLELGQHGHLSVTTPAGCEFHGVLAAGESITWNRQIEITTRCSDYEELKRKIPSIADRLPACKGSIELEAATTFHVAPTGEEWPKNQQVIVLEVEGPAVEVASCDPDSDLVKGQPAPNTLVHGTEIRADATFVP